MFGVFVVCSVCIYAYNMYIFVWEANGVNAQNWDWAIQYVDTHICICLYARARMLAARSYAHLLNHIYIKQVYKVFHQHGNETFATIKYFNKSARQNR